MGREGANEETEETVHENCLEVVEACSGLVVADFSARNFERLETSAEIAERTGRRLVVTAKDAYMLHAIGCVTGACPMDSGEILVYHELKDRKRVKWETEVVISRWGDRYVSPTSIQENPGAYILCLSFFDLKHLLDISQQAAHTCTPRARPSPRSRR